MIIWQINLKPIAYYILYNSVNKTFEKHDLNNNELNLILLNNDKQNIQNYKHT